jgi:hypothetical protein
MSIAKVTSILSVIAALASTAAGGPSAAACPWLAQEIPCRRCVMGSVATHYAPEPPCWGGTTFTSQSMVTGHCGPLPGCPSQPCTFDVTITVASNSTCNLLEILWPTGPGPLVVASCTMCATLSWNSGTLSLGCSPVIGSHHVFQVKANGGLVDEKAYICNICQ